MMWTVLARDQGKSHLRAPLIPIATASIYLAIRPSDTPNSVNLQSTDIGQKTAYALDAMNANSHLRHVADTTVSRMFGGRDKTQ